jgi:hypothetical protein
MNMIVLHRNITTPITNNIYLTLSEKQVSPTTWYYFIFVHRVTKESVSIYLQNISTKDNFQKFEIGSDEFGTFDAGYYTYSVKAANNNGTAQVGDVLETGYMLLKDVASAGPVRYNEQSNQFKTYNG